MFYPAIEVIGALAAALIIWFGGGWTMQGTLTLGSLVAFLLYSQRFFRPISDMSEKFNVLQAAMASSERIFKLLDTPGPDRVAVGLTSGSDRRGRRAGSDPVGPRPDPVDPRRPRTTAGSIVFDDVSFAYNGTDYVLRNVSFEVRPGERVGIVGATGAGKSTLINLLLRFYDVTSGRILVDGVDVRRWTCRRCGRSSAWCSRTCTCSRARSPRTSGWGTPISQTTPFATAAAAVHAAAFIERLPNRYGQAVAERGATLSVGQKQLLSFARALAFDPASSSSTRRRRASTPRPSCPSGTRSRC